MYQILFSQHSGFTLVNGEYGDVPDKDYLKISKLNYKNIELNIYCDEDEDVAILEELKPFITLWIMEIVQPFEGMAVELIKNYKNSAFLVVGQSLKILKWSLKANITDAYVAALTVSSVKEKYEANSEFLNYLKSKLDKLSIAKPDQIIILDYANEGETLRAIKRDIQKIAPDLKIISIAYTSGGSLKGKIQEKGDYQIDVPIELPTSVSTLIDNQEIKDLLGRGKPKLEYKNWSKINHNAENLHIGERYQSIKKSYLSMISKKEMLQYVDSFTKSFKQAVIYAKEDELYRPEFDEKTIL